MNRTRFHSLSSEFSLYYMELESSEIHSSTNEKISLHSAVNNYSLDFLESIMI